MNNLEKLIETKIKSLEGAIRYRQTKKWQDKKSNAYDWNQTGQEAYYKGKLESLKDLAKEIKK